MANSAVSMGRSQRRRNWSGECPGAAGSNTMMTGCSQRHGMLQPRSSLKIGQALQRRESSKCNYYIISPRVIIKAIIIISPSDTRRTNHSQRELQSEGLGSHARMDFFACSTWHSKADSASAAATPPVAEAAVSSTALSNAANSVGGYKNHSTA